MILNGVNMGGIRFFIVGKKSKFIGMADSLGHIIKEGDTMAQEGSAPLNYDGKYKQRFWHVINWIEGKRCLVGKDYDEE